MQIRTTERATAIGGTPGTPIDNGRWSIALKPTFIVVVLGFLFLTVSALSGLALFGAMRTVDIYADHQFKSAARVEAYAIEQLVRQVPAALREYAHLITDRTIAIDDEPLIIGLFEERLRNAPGLASIGLIVPSRGRLIHAVRVSHDGPGLATAVDRIPDDGYSWMQEPRSLHAVARMPWQGTDGRRSVRAVLPVVPETSDDIVALLFADLSLDELSVHLRDSPVGETGRLHLLTAAGEPIVMHPSWQDGDPELQTAIRTLGLDPAAIPASADGEPEFVHDGEPQRYFARPLEFADAPGWVVAAVAPESAFTGSAQTNMYWVILVGLVGMATSTLVAVRVSNRISVPLSTIAADLERVARFELEPSPPPATFVREVVTLGDTADRMKSSLRSFQRYVPADLVREILASGREAQLGGQRRHMTIHFSDIAGFTSIAETMTPEHLVEELGDYFELMRGILRAHHGTIDKYMGDGILAFFNAPLDVANHEIEACRAALIAQAALGVDRERRRVEERPLFTARIGLEAGEVVVGNIGTPDRFAYTVIGDPVNLAARLESLNKFYGTSILASSALRDATGGTFEWRRLDRAAVVGRAQGTDVHELLGLAGKLSPSASRARDAYEEALGLYFARGFAEATERFRALAADDPTNQAAAVLADRARELARRPPDDDWNGVYSHARK